MKYLYLWEVDKISRDGGFVLWQVRAVSDHIKY